jgi:hypothetical protein
VRPVVRKRFTASRGEILRRRERVVFATADAIGQPVAEGRDIRTGWRCPACPILGDRLDGVGAAGGEPIDPIRRGAEQGHGIVLVAQPVDQCPAVEHDSDVFAGGRVANGCRQRLGLEFVDSRVKVSSRCGWAALQAVSAAQAWKRLPKPARAFCQFPGMV